MVRLPQETQAEKINSLIEKPYEVPEYPREYLGYSSLGGPCPRALWYSFRWVKLRTTSPRMKRLFARGDWEEHRVIQDLQRIGVKVSDEQREVKHNIPHILGHIDGIADCVPGFDSNEQILLEIKTANSKNFAKFKKTGVKTTSKTYWYQSISYMGKMNLNYCLFICTNKDTEERYIEIIKFDKEAYDFIEVRALDILSTDVPPERIGSRTWYECKFCDFYEICHDGANIHKSCRSCKKGTIEGDGSWTCGGMDTINIPLQKIGCHEYSLLDSLKTYAIKEDYL